MKIRHVQIDQSIFRICYNVQFNTIFLYNFYSSSRTVNIDIILLFGDACVSGNAIRYTVLLWARGFRSTPQTEFVFMWGTVQGHAAFQIVTGSLLSWEIPQSYVTFVFF